MATTISTPLAVTFVSLLVSRGWLSATHFKHIELRWIPLTLELDQASKFDRSPSFIRMLMQHGETAATSFLAHLP